MGFGLPEYLGKKFDPAQYAENQQAMAGNPMAAKYGGITGDVASVAIPAVGGAIKGAQLASRAGQALTNKLLPNAAGTVTGDLLKRFGQLQGATTGGMMGAQAGVAAPEVLQGNPANAVAKSELLNQSGGQIASSINPFLGHVINPLGGVSGHIMPAIVGGVGSAVRSGTDYLKNNLLGQPAPNMAPTPTVPVTPAQPTGTPAQMPQPRAQMDPKVMTQYIALQKLLESQRRQQG